MNKRGVEIDWSNVANASPKPKRLHLEEDDSDGLFHCPVQECNHDGFTTQRGCRNTQRTNTLGTITSMENPASLRLKLVTKKATELRPMITRIQVKPGEFFLLTCQTTLLKSFYPSLPAVVGDVKVIGKHTKLSANV